MRWPALVLILTTVPSPLFSATTVAADPGEQVICKRQVETGTLAKFTKTCMTRNEWQRLRARSQEMGQNLRDRNFSSCAMSAVGATRSAEAAPAC